MTRSLPKPDASETSATPAPQTAESTPPKRKFNPRLLIPVVLLLVGLGTWYWLSRPKTGPLQISGRLEGYETDVGAKIGGRVDEVTVREGDRVTQGQLIAQLDDSEIQAQLQGAEARVTSAQEQARQAELQLSVVQQQIQEAQLNVQQSTGSAQGQIAQAKANVAAVNAQRAQTAAQVNQAQAELRLARINRDRFQQLRAEGAVTQQQLDQAQTALETAEAVLAARQAAVNAAAEQLTAAQGTLTQVQTTGLNPEIRGTQLAALRTQLLRAEAQVAAAQSDVKNARANRQQIQAQIAYLKIKSPINGIVTARSVEPGAVVTNGKTLVTVLNPSTVYLRGFVPAGEIGQIRVGQAARVYLDSNPDQPFKAKVSAIDPQASFTPENIYFKQDRVKQVFGVKIAIDQPGGWAKPGMPADAEIVTEQKS